MKKCVILVLLGLTVQDSSSKIPQKYSGLEAEQNSLEERLEAEQRARLLSITNRLREKINYYLFQNSIIFNENSDLNINQRTFDEVMLQVTEFKLLIINIINLLNNLIQQYPDSTDVTLFIINGQNLSLNQLIIDFNSALQMLDLAVAKAYLMK